MGTNKRIAVLSGKGGTGKTLISVNLAAADGNGYYVDCDVEEPNGHLYFKPQICEEKAVLVLIPKVNYELCTGCKDCVNFCKFNALAFGKKVILFKEICHSCGGCALVCSDKAITETEKTVGIVNIGISENVKTVGGMMNTGEASGIPIIKKILEYIKDKSGYIFIDCPPGSACIVMESIKDADYCILVAEPTIFGAHNLAMVYELVRLFDKPCGVVLNKCTDGHNPSEEFCREKGIEILVKIPFDKELGELNSNGKIAVREDYKNKELFYSLLNKVKEAVE
ncbi:MAG TPA: ATP-binding protein [Eubacteriales bacterium]|nr:ATP-binding protein [Eubacteriales bacterium]